jgi:hypothetical protein
MHYPNCAALSAEERARAQSVSAPRWPNRKQTGGGEKEKAKKGTQEGLENQKTLLKRTCGGSRTRGLVSGRRIGRENA